MLKRQTARKMLTYGILQQILEKTIDKMPELHKADKSQLKMHIFNGLHKQVTKKLHSLKKGN